MRKLLLFGLASAVMGLASSGPSLTGRWDATVVVNGITIPFRFEVTGNVRRRR